MTFWDFFRRKKKEVPEVVDDSLEVKSEQPISLYGGLCIFKAGHILVADAIAHAIMDLAYALFFSNRQGYPVIYDRYLMFKVKPKYGIRKRKRAFWFVHRQERKSLKQLGWLVVNLK